MRALLELLKTIQQGSQTRCLTIESATQNTSEASSVYPLRGLPLVIAEDFDEPIPEIWEALSE